MSEAKRKRRSNQTDVFRMFRSPRWLVVVCVLGACLFLLIAFAQFWAKGIGLTFFGLVGLSVIGLAGLADAISARVIIDGDALHVVKNLRRRKFVRSEFTAVTWAKGCPVSLQRTDGSWMELPAVGTSAQGMCNTLRVWLRGAAGSGQADEAQSKAPSP